MSATGTHKNPSQIVGSARQRVWRVLAIAGWVVVGCVGVLMLLRTSTINYSPDSWSYVDIARGMFEPRDGFGSIQGGRDFTNTPWVNDSFPFFWPLLIAPGVALFGPEIAVGGYLAVLIWIASCIVIALILRAVRSPAILGPVLGLALLALPGYAHEIHVGRSIPLTILLLISAILILVRMPARSTIFSPLLIGAFLGLGAATRFDALTYGPLFVLLALAFGFFTFRDTILAAMGWFVFPLAWSVYSMFRLGGPYVTDNSRVLLSPERLHVTYWPVAPASGSGGPGNVLDKMVGNFHLVLKSLNSAFHPRLFLLGAVAIFVLVALLLIATNGRLTNLFASATATDRPTGGRYAALLIELAAALVIVQAALMAGTGYDDQRYWAAAGALALLAIGCVVPTLLSDSDTNQTVIPKLLGLTSIIMVAGLAVVGLSTVIDQYRSFGDQSAEDAAEIACLASLDEEAVIGTSNAYRIPATTQFRVSTIPRNAKSLSAADWAELSDKYGITKWVVTGDGRRPPKAARGIFEIVKC